MNDASLPTHGNVHLCLCGFIVILLLLPSCALKKYSQQAEVFENIGSIKGRVETTSRQKGSVFALLYRKEHNAPLLIAERIVSQRGQFSFDVVPGNYHIAAYIDTNQDGAFQDNEHGNFHGKPTTIPVSAKEEVLIHPIIISGKVPKTDKKVAHSILATWKNNGTTVTLDDPRFTRNYYTMGLWEPIDFLEQAEGGLFFLQDFQEDKIPILFIHGANGGPTDLTYLIKEVDKDHFQPWVIYYPSGIRLDTITNYLVDALVQMEHRHKFSKIIVVGHSMGGLIARSFVRKFIAQEPNNSKKVKMVLTINAPMGGLTSAEYGVKNSPIVIPSWRDLAENSDFIKSINAWNWPKSIPYHLVISYQTGKSGDGIVPLQSQSSRKLQDEATRIYLFNNSHVGILSDHDFAKTFNHILSDLTDSDTPIK